MDLSPYLVQLKLVHVLAVIGFVLIHGASALVALRVRRERDRTRIMALLELSVAYQNWGWGSLLVALLAGVISGIAGGWWTGGQLWLWASLVVFVLVSGLMTPIAAQYLNDVRHAVGMATYADTRGRLVPPPPSSDDDLAREVKLGQRTEALGESINLHLVMHLNGHRGEINLIRGMLGFDPVLLNQGA